eukprot:9470874-Pyramimonas_sp.AAC.1
MEARLNPVVLGAYRGLRYGVPEQRSEEFLQPLLPIMAASLCPITFTGSSTMQLAQLQRSSMWCRYVFVPTASLRTPQCSRHSIYPRWD